MHSVCAFEYYDQFSQPVFIYLSGLIQSGPVSQSELGWLLLPASHHATGSPTTMTKTPDKGKGTKEKGKGREKERKGAQSGHEQKNREISVIKKKKKKGWSKADAASV